MFNGENQKRQWMEDELERSLRRVAAPQELWDRLQSRQPARSSVRTRFMAWAAVPVVMFAALLGSHTRDNPAIQFRSSDPAEISAWVKANTGLDVPLHAGNLAGACRVSGLTTEIAYRVGRHNLSLLVNPPATASRAGKTISWRAGGQAYLLASAEPQYLKACTLCHVGG